MDLPKVVIYKGEKFWLQSSGRYYQSGQKDGAERLLHRRVWIEHHGNIPDDFHVHHRNGDWTDNRIENLSAVSSFDHHSEHMRERMADKEFRAVANAGLAKAVIAAAEWHGSPEGIAWHKEHGKRTWEGRVPVKATCSVCTKEYETYFPSNSRFCSRSCEQKEGFQRNKTSAGVCVKCGKAFFFNKYRKQECCSRTCAVRLRAERSRLLKDSALSKGR